MEQEVDEKEWEAITNNFKKYKGKVIRFRGVFSCERSYDLLPYFGPLYISVFRINGNPSCPILTFGSPGLHVSKGSLFLITGKVDHLTRNGEILLIPLKIVRLSSDQV